MKVYLECVGCVLYLVVESCGVQVGDLEGQGRGKFFIEECREGVWSDYH